MQETFAILQDLRAKGMTILMVEQNAKRALEVSDFGVVIELGRTRMAGEARAILADPKVGQLFLGGGLVTSSGLTWMRSATRLASCVRFTAAPGTSCARSRNEGRDRRAAGTMIFCAPPS